MAECCICKKKIGGWGEDKYILDKERGLLCCYQCAPLIRNIENAENLSLLEARVAELRQKLESNEVSPEVMELLEAKMNVAKTDCIEANTPEFFCPICGNAMDRDAEECPVCGYKNFVSGRFRTNEQIAQIYNQRFEQYPRNAMYEYRIETVKDTAILGKFDKSTTEQILLAYAKHGWRLHTAFTNEVGKNAAFVGIGGVNATIEETVLIFERCIKAEER